MNVVLFFHFFFFNSQSFPPFLFPRKKAFLLPSTPDGVDVFFLRFFYGTRRRKRFVYSVDRKKEKKRKRGLFLGAPFRVEFFGRRSTVAEIGKWDIENQSKR